MKTSDVNLTAHIAAVNRVNARINTAIPLVVEWLTPWLGVKFESAEDANSVAFIEARPDVGPDVRIVCKKYGVFLRAFEVANLPLDEQQSLVKGDMETSAAVSRDCCVAYVVDGTIAALEDTTPLRCDFTFDEVKVAMTKAMVLAEEIMNITRPFTQVVTTKVSIEATP